jgi:hypothetical protein
MIAFLIRCSRGETFDAFRDSLTGMIFNEEKSVAASAR